MMAGQRISLAVVLVAVAMVLPVAAQGTYAVKACKVLTMDDADTVLNNVVVFVRDGKIEKIEPQRTAVIPDGYQVFDHGENWLVPGFIDCHNHVAACLNDLNDGVWLTNPGLRTQDVVAAGNIQMKIALASGVTSVLIIPGSGTNLSGFGTIVRSAGETQDEVVMRAPGSMKIAQAGNPEGYWFGVGRTYMNYNLRQTLRKAKEYDRKWTAWEKGDVTEKPELDMHWHEMRAIMQGKVPASVHTQIYQVALKTITMLPDEFGIRTMLDHSTFDSYKAAREAIKRDLYVIVGPRVWWQDPADGTVNSCAGRWWDRGQRKLGINTDSPVVPQEELQLQAALSVHYGWETYPAIKGLTRIPADALAVGHRVGRIVPGMEGDFCLWTGDPLDPRSHVTRAFVAGKPAYDASKGRLY